MRGDLLDASKLEVVEEEQVPAEVARLPGEEPEPQGEWTTPLHIPDQPEEALEPERAVRLGVMAHAWRCLPLTPPGLSELLAIESGPPPLEDADLLVGVPQGAWLDLTSLGSMQMIFTQNTLMGEFEYHYKTRVISQTSLHLTLPDFPDQPNTHWELEEP